MEVSEYKKIKCFLETNIYPKSISISKVKKRNFRRKCQDYVLINGILHHQENTKTPLRVLKITEMDAALKKLHSDEFGGHLGINKTWRKIRERYYWKNSYECVKKYIEECDQCQRKAPLKKARKPLRPIEVKSEPFSQIGMDLVGPLEKTKNGNRYIVVITEYLTKWVDAEPIQEKTAENVLQVLSRFVSNHGVPKVLITDQGREFCNQLNDRFCEQFEIDHRVASPYHPQTGGHTERYNRTLCEMLAKYVNEKQSDWDEKIHLMLFAYCTSVHATTKESPFYLVYGRQARLPLDLELPVGADQNESPEDNLKKRCDAFLHLKRSREGAANRIRSAQKTQKKHYDKKAAHGNIKKGDNVLVHNTRKTTRKGGKLSSRWIGPYVVKDVLQKGTYKLEGLKHAVNGSRIKLYATRDKKSSGTKKGRKERTKQSKNENVAEEKKNSESDSDDNTKNDVTYSDHENPSNPLQDAREDSSSPIIVSQDEGKTLIDFFPTDGQWQREKSVLFDVKVKNINENGRRRKVKITAGPGKIASMRGDGNCLFRAFSFILFGVQSYHQNVREKLVHFMEENEALFSEVENTPMGQYISASKMKEHGTWGTELEILAFSSMCNTTVHVHCLCDGQNWKWLPYRPLSRDPPNNRSVYLVNKHGHFEPVLDIQEEFYSRTPYLRIGDYLDNRFKNYVSQEMLESSLVNSDSDEQKLRDFENINPTHIFSKKFTDIYCTPCKYKIDPNIFNLLCDWSDFEQYL